MNTEIILGLVGLITSTITGVIGVGGGLLLIAAMPVFLPAALIIPMHSVTQVASNASRALLALKSVEWRFFPGFFFGSALGVSCFGLFFASLPSQYLPLGIGGYILLSLWSRKFDRLVRRYETFFSAGFFQTGLGTLIRGRIDGEKFIIYLKWSLSLLAVYMIVRVCLSYLTIVD